MDVAVLLIFALFFTALVVADDLQYDVLRASIRRPRLFQLAAVARRVTVPVACTRSCTATGPCASLRDLATTTRSAGLRATRRPRPSDTGTDGRARVDRPIDRAGRGHRRGRARVPWERTGSATSDPAGVPGACVYSLLICVISA